MANPAQCNNDVELTTDDILERHERDLYAFKQLNPAEQARQQIKWRAQYASNPWAFLSDCVFTLDQVDADKPIKPFPSYRKYIEFLVKLWMRDDSKLIGVPKSRRMTCSWSFIACYTHDTIFNPGKFNALVSKKEDDSADLVGRAEFIFKKIPDWRIPRALLPTLKNGRMSKQPPLMEFEEIHSKLQGFPQGADQMRQFTFSGALLDEWAFWEEAQPAYSALKPTLDGGGRLTGISSRARGAFFKKIVYDRLDANDLNFRETPPVAPQQPLPGVTVWRNPKNRFVIVDLSWRADPIKRQPGYIEAIRESMPAADYAMEYEDSWQSFEGKPVFPDFQKSLHVGVKLSPEPGCPLLLGWDFGLTPACILAQFVGRRLIILKEFIETDGSISKLAPVVWNYLFSHFLPWVHSGNITSFIDPAGTQRAQTDERTCADVLRQTGFKNVRPGPVAWEERRKAVEDYIVKVYGEGPGLHVDGDQCPVLVDGLAGGYRYPEVELEPAKIRPLKNNFSHPADALQYLCAGATQLRKSYGFKDIPIPQYSFQSQHQEKSKWQNEKMNSLGLENLTKPT